MTIIIPTSPKHTPEIAHSVVLRGLKSVTDLYYNEGLKVLWMDLMKGK